MGNGEKCSWTKEYELQFRNFHQNQSIRKCSCFFQVSGPNNASPKNQSENFQGQKKSTDTPGAAPMASPWSSGSPGSVAPCRRPTSRRVWCMGNVRQLRNTAAAADLVLQVVESSDFWVIFSGNSRVSMVFLLVFGISDTFLGK